MIPISEWKWSGRAGHFICSDRCRYHLTTIVGDYIISTVGDLHYTHREDTVTVGYNSFYETMVFETGELSECGCYTHGSGEIEVRSYGKVKCSELDQGHFNMCIKYAKMQEV